MRWLRFSVLVTSLWMVVSVQAQDPGGSGASTGHEARLPIQAPDTDLSVALDRDTGVFSWAFGATGWPNGLSAWGQDPNHTQVRWDGRSIEDLVTGRPRLDMVPIALLAQASWQEDGRVSLQTDPLSMSYPLTRVRYASAGDGLQAVNALHVQNRVLRSGKSSGMRLQTVFGYAGAASQGEYDGSQLRRAREITLRIGLEGASWSAWIQDVAARRAVGAHAGVEPIPGAGYESIYQRLGATVEDPTARRRTIWNDLELGGRSTWRGWAGTLRAVRTSQTLDFDGSTLSTRGWTTRWQLLPSIETVLGPGTLKIHGHSMRESGFGGSAWTSSPGAWTQSGLAVAYHANEDVNVHVGMVNTSDYAWWHALVSGAAQKGPLRVHGHVERDARRLSLLERAGFGAGIGGMSSATDIPLQERILIRAGANLTQGIWQIGVEASHLRETDAIIHQLATVHPGLDSRIMNGVRSRSLLSLSLGWRADGRRGPYARIEGVLGISEGPDNGGASMLWEQSLPQRWASGRFGWKALLFQKDLDLDLFIRGRMWDAMNGLRLHTPTGLLVLPEDFSAPMASNWMVDVGAEGDVRGATLFLAYENMFSGTTWQIGNLLVPDYPLPRQRVRFGVYWPISN